MRFVRRHTGNRRDHLSSSLKTHPGNSMKLRRNQYCPIHHSLSCCGRDPVPKGRGVRRLGVQRIEDSHHPRGYRELRSKAEMRKLLDRKIVEQNRQCAICQVAFTHYATSCLTTWIREGWEDRAETTIRRTFRQCTGGVTARRDPRGNLRNCRPVFCLPFDRVLIQGYKPSFRRHIAYQKGGAHVSAVKCSTCA
jgi:hypothetical protein